jgi:hypothetical protein
MNAHQQAIAKSYKEGNYTQAKAQIREAFKAGVNPTHIKPQDLFGGPLGDWGCLRFITQATKEVQENP